MLNLSWSAVSFNQSAQQVESFLKKEEDLHTALTAAAKAQWSRGTSLLVEFAKSSVSTDKPLPKGLSCAAERLKFPTKIWHFVQSLPIAEADVNLLIAVINFLSLSFLRKELSGIKHSDCFSTSNPAPHLLFLPYSYRPTCCSHPASSSWAASLSFPPQRSRLQKAFDIGRFPTPIVLCITLFLPFPFHRKGPSHNTKWFIEVPAVSYTLQYSAG